MPEDKASVRISATLYEEIRKRVESKALPFETVDAFVEYAISDILDIKPAEQMSPEDEETVSKRLSAFGY